MPLLGWLKGSAQPTTDVSGWDEFPVHLNDGSKVNHKVLGWSMRFDNVLDADMLHSALLRLLDRPDWRRLGGRLKRDKNDQLKIFVPKAFTETHPAIEYNHVVFSQAIAAHPIGSQFIKATAEPSIQPLEKDVRYFMAPEDYPETVDSLVQTDKSQLSLMISSFDDATIVSMAFPHTLLDGNGFINLVQNWSLVLAGREAEVTPFLDPHVDILEEVIKADTSSLQPEECRMETMRLTGFAFWKFLGRQMAEAAQRKRRLQSLYIPRDTYQKLLYRLKDDDMTLDGEDQQSPDRRRVANEVDMLTVWLVRTIAAQESTPRPVNLVTLYDLRYYVKALKDARLRGNFAQGLVNMSCAMFPADTPKKSICALARAYKEQLADLTTEEEVLAYMKQRRNELRKKKPDLALYGSTDSLLVMCNPVARLDLIKMADFGPAVKHSPEGEARDGSRSQRQTPAGRMAGNVFNALNWTDAGVDLLFLLGPDYEGGCWIMAKMSPGSWTSVAEQLRAL